MPKSDAITQENGVLWGGRFSVSTDLAFKQFNDSLPFDYQLAKQDIVTSKAWANAIHGAGVLTDDECQSLHQALDELLLIVTESPNIILESDEEDIHSWVEQQLVNKLGSLGKKLHTGRSRNDQVATDFKLWAKQKATDTEHLLLQLQAALIKLAENNTDVIIPGFTHLQRAQPILFAHWALAYVEMLERDIQRLQDSINHNDTCPLGSGALAGTGFNIDRDALARELGFYRATSNSLDSASDRDFVVEMLSTASLSMIHLSRMAEDLIFYNSGEAGFIEFDDSITSGSSIMPQKKNPDLMELIRGKSGRVCGSLVSMLMTLKALPMAYNKDLQEDKEGLFDAINTWQQCLSITSIALNKLTVNAEVTYKAAQEGYSNATELADYLVRKGLPFREAHHVVGKIVSYAIGEGLALESVPLSTLQSFNAQIQDDIFALLTPEACLNTRNAKGGTSLQQVNSALQQARRTVNAELAVLNLIRQAKLSDVSAIMQLINTWAAKGENLP